MFKAGVALRDISPDEDAHYLLCGYPEPPDRAHTGIHDPLFASGLYLADGESELLLFAMDFGYYSKRRTASTRALIQKACGIPASNIMITCTHTHSAPNPKGDPFKMKDDEDETYPQYIDFIENSLVEIACEAKEKAFAAELAVGVTVCGKQKNIGGNRHDPSWPCDPEVWVIAVRDEVGKLRGVMLEYSLHPTLLHAENTLITADFPAYIREYLNDKYEGLVFGFLQGTSGNQSSRFFRDGQSFTEAKRYGYTLAAAAEEVIAHLDFSAEHKLAVISENITLPLKSLPTVEEAKSIADSVRAKYEEMVANNEAYPLVRSQECRMIGADYKYEVAKAVSVGGKELLEVDTPMEIQIFSIGDTRLVGMQGETFVEFGLEIKAESPYKKTFVVTLANGITIGYLCTAKAHEEGGYEALGTMITPEAGELVTDKIIALLKQS